MMKRPTVYAKSELRRKLDRGSLTDLHYLVNLHSKNISYPENRIGHDRRMYWLRRSYSQTKPTQQDLSYWRWVIRGNIKDGGEDE